MMSDVTQVTAAMDESANRLQDEVRRVVEQAKELQETAAAAVAKSSTEEVAIRQRVTALDSTITRIRSSICSMHMDPKFAEKVFKTTEQNDELFYEF